MGPRFWLLAIEHDKNMIYKNMEYSYNFSNSEDHQPYLQDSSLPGISLRLGPIIQPIPHRTPVALFWDLFRGLHLTSWRWMACQRSNYPHDLLGVSETLQPDYPRVPPDHGWSTFRAMTHFLQLSSTFVDHLQSSQTFTIKNHRETSLSRIFAGLVSLNLRGSPARPIYSSTFLQCDGVSAPS